MCFYVFQNPLLHRLQDPVRNEANGDSQVLQGVDAAEQRGRVHLPLVTW